MQFRVDVRGPEQKMDILRRFIFSNADRLGQTIIFVHTRASARELHEVPPHLRLKFRRLRAALPNSPEEAPDARFCFCCTGGAVCCAAAVCRWSSPFAR